MTKKEVLPDQRIEQILNHLAHNGGVSNVVGVAMALGVEDYEAFKMVKHGSSFALWCFGSDQKIRDTSVLIGYVTPLFILLERDSEDSKQLLKVLAELDQGTEGLIDWMLEWCREHQPAAQQLVLDILKRDWPSGLPSLPSHLAYHVPFQQENKDDVLELVQAIEEAFTGPLKNYEDADFHLADARELREKWSKSETGSNSVAEQALPIGDRFVGFWTEASSLADVASEFSITPREASKKANYLRSKGIDLKKFKRVPNATNAEFLRVWNESESIIEVADKLGLKPSYIHAKVMRLRRSGEHIVSFSRGANIAQDEFTHVWNGAGNAKAVANHFRISIPTVNRLRTQFRKQGSDLKRMPRSRQAA